MSAPTIPKPLVTRQPPGSFPGMMNFAMPPASRPNRICANMLRIAALQPMKGACGHRPRAGCSEHALDSESRHELTQLLGYVQQLDARGAHLLRRGGLLFSGCTHL